MGKWGKAYTLCLVLSASVGVHCWPGEDFSGHLGHECGHVKLTLVILLKEGMNEHTS